MRRDFTWCVCVCVCVCVQGPGGGPGDGGGLVSEGGVRLGRGQGALRGVRQDAAGRPQQGLLQGQEEGPAAGIPAAPGAHVLI